MLAPFADSDLDQLLGWIDSPDLMGQWAGSAFAFPLTPDQWSAHVSLAGARGGYEIYKVVDETSGETVGHIEFAVTSRAHGTGWVGRVFIAPERRGCGLGVQLMREVLELAFDHRELHRVELAVFDFNHAAISCYERVGFRREGVRRESYKGTDGYWNSVVMGILEPEWRASRAPQRA